MKTADLLNERLELVFDWHRGMINPDTGMLEYLYRPDTDTFVRENCPIRDIASVWDLELLSEFLKRKELRTLIDQSLSHFSDYLIQRDGYLILDPRRLGEPSSIAHSAFLILALLHAPSQQEEEKIAALAEGILRQQRPDGSYQIYFHDLPDTGEELYAGEAMLALIECYRRSQDIRLLQSVEGGFAFYDARYFQRGRVSDEVLVFFANWQSQVCRLLFESCPDAELKKGVANFVFRLHDRIIDRGFYTDVERRPGRQVSVEVACALEGLNAAYAIARTNGDDRTESYRKCIGIGLNYLLCLQCTRGGTTKERGGFGLSLSDRTQRIDITGHAASAFIKSIEHGIDCGAAG